MTHLINIFSATCRPSGSREQFLPTSVFIIDNETIIDRLLLTKA
jgi:hypothetical protein